MLVIHVYASVNMMTKAKKKKVNFWLTAGYTVSMQVEFDLLFNLKIAGDNISRQHLTANFEFCWQ